METTNLTPQQWATIEGIKTKMHGATPQALDNLAEAYEQLQKAYRDAEQRIEAAWCGQVATELLAMSKRASDPYYICPACSSPKPHNHEGGAFTCPNCGGVYGVVSERVAARFCNWTWAAVGDGDVSGTRYIDFIISGVRWHGWVSIATKHIVQSG